MIFATALRILRRTAATIWAQLIATCIVNDKKKGANPKKKAIDTRSHLMKTWVQPFGLMELLVVDQGPEFAGEEFADDFREQGVLVHLAFKEMLEK